MTSIVYFYKKYTLSNKAKNFYKLKYLRLRNFRIDNIEDLVTNGFSHMKNILKRSIMETKNFKNQHKCLKREITMQTTKNMK